MTKPKGKRTKKAHTFTRDTAPVRNLQNADELVAFLNQGGVMTDANGLEHVGASGNYYLKPAITAAQVYDIARNNYVTEHVRRLKSLLFITRPVIRVLDADENEDEELSAEMEALWDEAAVDGWTRMQQAWVDMFIWGCALFNVVYARDGPNAVLRKIRRLPPESFADPPTNAKGLVYSHILRGITVNAQGEVECYQTQEDGQPHLVQNVTILKDPTASGVAGESQLVPVIPIVRALTFAWVAQQQKVNRIGAPIVFLKWTAPPVKNAYRDDIAHAKTILQNWGKGTAFQLQDNMELVTLNFTDNQSAIQTIDALERRLRDYFSPATIIRGEGATISESGGAKLDLVTEWIRGEHNVMEGIFERILQDVLEANAFEGYLVEIEIPEPTPDRQLSMAQAEAGFRTEALFTNEIRTLLGVDELTDEELEKLKEEYESRRPPAPTFGNPFGGAGIVPGREKDQEDAERDLRGEAGEPKKKGEQTFREHARRLRENKEGTPEEELEYALVEADKTLTERLVAALKNEGRP